MKKDYFAILGLKPSASDKEIRSAYKRLAKKCHPDLNPGDRRAEEKFKQISEAYEVLTDPQKRRRWEAGEADFASFFREAAARAGRVRSGGAAGEDPFTTFGLGGIFDDLFRGMRRQGMDEDAAHGADLQCEATLSFEEGVRGTTLRVPLARTVVCAACRATGIQARGRGAACATCRGSGRRRLAETIRVRIPPGAQDGARVRVAGKGEGGTRGGPPGDLYVVLRVAPHPYFRREGNDIVLDLPLTVSEALLGTRVEVPTLNGRVALRVPPGSSSGRRLRLRGRGVVGRDGRMRGDQIVVLHIVAPKSLDARSRRMLEEFERLNPADPRANLHW